MDRRGERMRLEGECLRVDRSLYNGGSEENPAGQRHSCGTSGFASLLIR